MTQSKWAAIAIGAFFLVFYNTLAGVLQIPPIYLDVARNAGASRSQVFRTVALPAAAPDIFTGLRLATGTAFVVLAAVEFVGGRVGLGTFIWSSWQTLQVDRMYLGTRPVRDHGLRRHHLRELGGDPGSCPGRVA